MTKEEQNNEQDPTITKKKEQVNMYRWQIFQGENQNIQWLG